MWLLGFVSCHEGQVPGRVAGQVVTRSFLSQLQLAAIIVTAACCSGGRGGDPPV